MIVFRSASAMLTYTIRITRSHGSGGQVNEGDTDLL